MQNNKSIRIAAVLSIAVGVARMGHLIQQKMQGPSVQSQRVMQLMNERKDWFTAPAPTVDVGQMMRNAGVTPAQESSIRTLSIPQTTTRPTSTLPPSAAGLGFSFAETAGAPRASGATAVPPRVDLTADLPVPGDQGDQSSCVGWATAALKHYQEIQEMRRKGYEPGKRSLLFSPAFFYNAINVGLKNGEDAGSLVCCALHMLESDGAALFTDVPYDDTNFTKAPSPQVLAKARQFRARETKQLYGPHQRDLNTLRAWLAAGYPIVIHVDVDDSFLELAGPGATYSRTTGPLDGGHAMLLAGYDDARQAFRVLNSWGTDWGDGGYAWVTYGMTQQILKSAYTSIDEDNEVAAREAPANETHWQMNHTLSQPEQQQLQTQTTSTQPTLRLTNVRAEMPTITHPQLGRAFQFAGTARIPPTAGRQAKVAILFSQNDSTGTLKIVRTALPNSVFDSQGYASVSTGDWQIAGDRPISWQLSMPYVGLGLGTGQQRLTAHVFLFVDGRIVAQSEPVQLVVNR